MRYLITFFLVLILIGGCKKEDSTPVTPVQDTPTVKIVNPVNNQNILDSVTIKIEASDPKGVTKVELFIQNNMVKEFAVKPYTYFWDFKGLPDSSQYSIYAKAHNSDDKVTGSEVINVTINRLSPSNLEILSLSKDTVHLKWKDNSVVEESYIIQVSTNSVSFTTIAELPANTTEAIISYSFSFGVKYYFRVGAKKVNTVLYSSISSKIAFDCGNVTVQYEGKIYNTVLIGNQCWLKENLNVGTRINGSNNQTNNGTIEKYCYNDNESNCDTYGGLYQWNEAMQYSTTAGTKGICPTGWHIPTYAEMQTLAITVGNNSNALKAVGQGSGGGAGTNTSGFSALLAGIRNYDRDFGALGFYAYFWSSAEDDASNAPNLYLYFNDGNVYFNILNKIYGFSVRCVKD